MNNQATYSPEDNKLRLYVGRVPREEYDALREQGWTAAAKQNCDFVAKWSIARRNTCLEYAEIIEDEDQSPEDRAADRAERFAGYREKRTNEAIAQADRYDAGPAAHGYQSEARATRAANRHDRIAGKACDAWGKAEYWQRRTAGVIQNALYKSTPGVRMGRIKEIEADIRAMEKNVEKYAEKYSEVQKIAANPAEAIASLTGRFGYDEAKATRNVCDSITGYGKHRNPINLEAPEGCYSEHQKSEHPPTVADYAAQYLRTHCAVDSEAWQETNTVAAINHEKMRLAYENQMLEAAGGRAALIEMKVGGWIGSHQIRKVNKSPATGRVVSVTLRVAGNRWGRAEGPGYHDDAFNIERLPQDAYRTPSAEDIAALSAKKKAEKKAEPEKAPCPLINPTDEDAERLVAIWNASRLSARTKYNAYGEFKPCEVRKMPQAFYSEHSKGSYAKAGTKKICAMGGIATLGKSLGPELCQIRTTGFDPLHLIIITDKPQKPFPASVWEAHEPAQVLATA